MLHHLIFALSMSLGIQAVFFAFAAALKTDKVTDLSYGLTFVLMAAVALVHSDRSVPAVVLAALGVWAVLGAAGPVAITALLLFVTGIPPLEAAARKRWGDDPDYRAYRRRTRTLLPWPRS